MPGNKEPQKTVEKIREKIAALVKRSADKLEEIRGIQKRADALAEELSEVAKKAEAGRKAKGGSTRRAGDSR